MYLNLSYPLTESGIILESGMERPQVMPRSRISQGKHSNTSYFKMFAHTGTHLDAPWHFEESGAKIADFSVQELVFKFICVLDVPVVADEPIPLAPLEGKIRQLRQCDCLLVRTGFAAERTANPEVYLAHNPGFSEEAVCFLASLTNLRCLGMDLPSVENIPHGRETGFPVHHALLGRPRPMLLLEDANLAALDNHEIQSLFLFPLLLEGLEAAPVTAVAEITE
jgi:arylformamidase